MISMSLLSALYQVSDIMDSEQNVWAVFANGSASQVVMIEIESDEKPGPPVLQPVGIVNLEVKTSAKKAIFSAYNALRSLARVDNGGHGFTYEFSESVQVVEASASLAFALKFVHLLEKIPFSIAATGIVPDSSPGARVKRVININEKLGAAAEKLSAGEMIFFPAGNLEELTEETKSAANEKGVILQPVETVAEAVSKLLAAGGSEAGAEAPVSPGRTPGRRWPFIFFLLALALGAALYLYKLEDIPPSSKNSIDDSTQPSKPDSHDQRPGLVAPGPSPPTSSESAEPVDPAPLKPDSFESVAPVDTEPSTPDSSESVGSVDPAPSKPDSSESAGSVDSEPSKPDSSESAGSVDSEPSKSAPHDERSEPVDPGPSKPDFPEPKAGASPLLDVNPVSTPGKKPAPSSPSSRTKKPPRVKTELNGPSEWAVVMMKDALAAVLENHEIIRDNKNYDGVIYGSVSLTEFKEKKGNYLLFDNSDPRGSTIIGLKLEDKSKQSDCTFEEFIKVPLDKSEVESGPKPGIIIEIIEKIKNDKEMLDFTECIKKEIID